MLKNSAPHKGFEESQIDQDKAMKKLPLVLQEFLLYDANEDWCAGYVWKIFRRKKDQLRTEYIPVHERQDVAIARTLEFFRKQEKLLLKERGNSLDVNT